MRLEAMILLLILTSCVRAAVRADPPPQIIQPQATAEPNETVRVEHEHNKPFSVEEQKHLDQAIGRARLRLNEIKRPPHEQTH